MACAHNGARLRDLASALNGRTVIPFVGAGLSAAYNLPQWSELLRNLSLTDEQRAQVDRQLREDDYEAAAEYLLQMLGPNELQIVLRQMLDVEVDAARPTALSRLLDLPEGPLITTNFDRVIERVFDAAHVPLNRITGNQPEEISYVISRNKNALIKIHGDIADPSHRVLAASEYDKQYSLWIERVLRNAATIPLLFLGYSLKTDRPVAILKRLVTEGHVLTSHFAILPKPKDDQEWARENRRLAEDLRVQVIWYPTGQHQWVESILTWLVEQVPPERRRNYKRKTGPRSLGIPDLQSRLYGRDEKMADLVRSLESGGVITVEGNRGAGKTAFALSGLRQFLNRDVFGALVWVSAAGQKEQLRLLSILKLISKTIDYPFAPETLVAHERKLAEELDRKQLRCLLVVDNYETVSDEDIHGFIFRRRPAGLTVLITSTGRVPGLADYRIEMKELDEPDALLFFKDRLTRHGLEQESEADLKRLYTVVGGNPLALEWIIGQLGGGRQLPLLLDALAAGKAEILTEVFNQSWTDLDQRSRTLLAALAVFVRPAPEEGLRSVSGLPPRDFENALARLVQLYMTKRLRLQEETVGETASPRKYFIHPFTRDFLEGERDTATAATLYGRAAEFYLRFVEERGGTPAREEITDQYELNDQKDNMLGVLHGCVKIGNNHAMVLLVQAMARWLFIESHWTDLLTWGNKAFQNALALGLPNAAARILNEIGRVYSNYSQFARAEDAFAKALELAQTTPPDLWAIAYIKHHRGEALLRQQRLDEARDLLRESLSEFQQLDSTREVIGVTYRLAMLAFAANNMAEANRLATQGVATTVNERWDRLQGFNHRLLGDVAVRQQQLTEGRFHYQRALELVPKTDMRIQAMIELSLARLEYASGQKDAAAQRAATAEAHFDKIGMRQEADEAAKLVLSIRGTDQHPRPDA